jgi:undecaprenyl-diphosphatase
MDLLLLLKVLVMGLIEGLTEFLPISSTGHLIVGGTLLKLSESLGGKIATDTFEIFIQLGAILAVVVYFQRDLLGVLRRSLSGGTARQLLVNVLLAFIPAAVIGFLLSDVIKSVLFTPAVVALSMIVGGVIMLSAEARLIRSETFELEQVTRTQALAIGGAQVLALIPGMSRSACTLIGGMLAGLDRETALRFSFYLAIPTLGAATVYDVIKSRDAISGDMLPAFALGLVVSFVVALVVVRFFLRYVAERDLRVFAFYRIGAGAILLALVAVGLI